ncbi:hypothetical protein VTK73DRAFT_5012 [Phialemonium thermophilum]|uniref:DEAD/DEAH-box helicase domain-containing protein n=1 Tax=Phialemonium thermophilum TaxID=223376 RepID=A0ABR3WQW4_9PEZI
MQQAQSSVPNNTSSMGSYQGSHDPTGLSTSNGTGTINPAQLTNGAPYPNGYGYTQGQSTFVPPVPELPVGDASVFMTQEGLIPISSTPIASPEQVFPFREFNKLQSSSFSPLLNTDDNFVASAPEGYGKGVLLDLAICRLMATGPMWGTKVLYLSYSAAKCRRKVKEWRTKFSWCGLCCGVAPGSTHHAWQSNTPFIAAGTLKMWEAATGEWDRHSGFPEGIRLVMIDDAHVLREESGALLEQIVSRLKKHGSPARMVALCSALHNPCAIADWLGRRPSTPAVPARLLSIAAKDRPVSLPPRVEKIGAHRGPEPANKAMAKVFSKRRNRPPMLVFCPTAASCVGTASALQTYYADSGSHSKPWMAPSTPIGVSDEALAGAVFCGVGFWYPGLGHADGQSVLAHFCKGNLSVVCCTPELSEAPIRAQTVFVKTPEAEGLTDDATYSSLQLVEMLSCAKGSPGGPKAAAIVFAPAGDVSKRYEKRILGQEVLESSLHCRLPEYLYREIEARNVVDLQTALQWLGRTYLRVRIGRRKDYYIDGATKGSSTPTSAMKKLCEAAIESLLSDGRITRDGANLLLPSSGPQGSSSQEGPPGLLPQSAALPPQNGFTPLENPLPNYSCLGLHDDSSSSFVQNGQNLSQASQILPTNGYTTMQNGVSVAQNGYCHPGSDPPPSQNDLLSSMFYFNQSAGPLTGSYGGEQPGTNLGSSEQLETSPGSDQQLETTFSSNRQGADALGGFPGPSNGKKRKRSGSREGLDSGDD